VTFGNYGDESGEKLLAIDVIVKYFAPFNASGHDVVESTCGVYS